MLIQNCESACMIIADNGVVLDCGDGVLLLLMSLLLLSSFLVLFLVILLL